ncbi:MAG: ribonuclease HII [Lentisphaeria bacterium]|nr:ribonuclease HII [Lentisphaeria bacterium]
MEKELHDEGFSFVAGVDEAGRGPLAGPVVAAAVIFLDYSRIPEVFDSKQLTEKAREELFEVLTSRDDIIFAFAEVDNNEIDRINILQATHLAMRTAVDKLSQKPDFVLIDGNPVKSMPYPNRSVVKGDAKCAAISAASIIAKVHRDRLMRKYAELYPEYGFDIHKGYGTAAHIKALKTYGAAPIHRKTFSPIREMLSPLEQGELF